MNKKIIIPLCLMLLVAGCSNDNPNRRNLAQDDVVVTKTEESLLMVKNNALKELNEYFNQFDKADYTTNGWNQMMNALKDGQKAIYLATTKEEVLEQKNAAIATLDDVLTEEEYKLSEKVTITPKAPISPSQGYTFNLSNIKNAENIKKVKVVMHYDFKGASSGKIYWGGAIQIGSTTQQIAQTGYFDNVDENDDNVNESTTQTIVFEPENVTSTSVLSVRLTYWGQEYDATVEEVSFYYDNGFVQTSETKELNHIAYENNNYHELKVPYSEFSKKGNLEKMVITLTSVNTETYVSGNIYVKGIDFCPSHLIAFGNTQVAGDTATGSVTIYPENSVDLNSNGAFVLDIWWAPCSRVTIDSITLYTDVESVPATPENMVAHEGNEYVYLSWDKADGATSYEVYKDGAFVMEVKDNYCVVEGLVNDTEYNFNVKAKNGVGTSNMSETVTATPNVNSSYDHVVDDLNSELEELIGHQNMRKMYEGSLISLGNNYRYREALEKMARNEKVKVGFIGGSITVGENAEIYDGEGLKKGYASYTFDYIKEKFCKNSSNVEYLNAAISGTGSEIGIVRMQNDLLNHKPDIIFIEFAGNNSSTDFYKETYEGMVRKCLMQENAPAVIFVFAGNDYTGNAEKYMTTIGNYYNIPMVSMDKALKAVCKTNANGLLDMSLNDPIFNGYIADGTHPNDVGHQLMGKVVCNFLKAIAENTKDASYDFNTTPLLSDKYDSLIELDNTTDVITELGSWEKTTTDAACLNQSHVTAFKNGWKKSSTTENEEMHFNIHAKNMIVIFRNEFNSANNGTFVVNYRKVGETEYNTFEYTCERGWANPVGRLIFDETESADYEISIKIKEDEKTGIIYGIGYSI